MNKVTDVRYSMADELVMIVLDDDEEIELTETEAVMLAFYLQLAAAKIKR